MADDPEVKRYSRRSVIKGAIVGGVAVSSTGYLFRAAAFPPSEVSTSIATHSRL
jgi:hypothetical protein